jgi:pleiotropic regulator 1
MSQIVNYIYIDVTPVSSSRQPEKYPCSHAFDIANYSNALIIEVMSSKAVPPTKEGVVGVYAAQSAFQSLKRARSLFPPGPMPPAEDATLRQASLDRRRRQWGAAISATATASSTALESTALSTALLTAITAPSVQASVIPSPFSNEPSSNTTGTTTLVLSSKATSIDTTTNIPIPKWHAPWKLSTVLSSHLGWVRSLAVDPVHNRLLATGSADRTIKIWNLPKATAGAEDALQITLTGHISAVRGLAFSERHPYLFSAGEDKTVKCWDLETNQVVRHYHGHLSGVYCLALHPTLDILITAGRDAVARVWDMRTKHQLHVLSGHEHTIAAVLTSSTHPQVVTGSHDCTVKMWDLAAGKCFTTLTHHSKSIRAMAAAPAALGERTFVSAAADSIRKWQGKNGRFLHRLSGHNAVLNAVAVQDDGVLVSGGDDGTMHFWDYQSGHCFQQEVAKVQPGSLQQAENGIMALQFDLTGTRLITGEADKSIKIWKQDETASEMTHPVDMKAWRKKCIAQAKERY